MYEDLLNRYTVKSRIGGSNPPLSASFLARVYTKTCLPFLELNPPRIVRGRFDPDAPGGPAANADAKLLAGIPVSPGIATGPARVILRADEHEQVLPGEMPIAPFTDPAWSWNKTGFSRTAASSRASTGCRQ